MATTLKAAVDNYLRVKSLARGTRNEYFSTLRKWEQWGGGVPIEELRRKDVREFLDWVYERAVAEEETNPGRTANKAREHLRAVLSWAWEQELIDSPPRFPKPREQRDVAGRHYLTKAEINALYFATHSMQRPRGWDSPIPVGRHWRAALVVFFNYGVDTGTVWKSAPFHEPILWRHVSWGHHPRIERSRSGHAGAGCSTAGSRLARRSTGP
jgi:Phage integrase, N-terminal SAM-like domain